MANPSTPIIDDFNRADAANLGSNWINFSVLTTHNAQIISNQASGQTGIGVRAADLYNSIYGPNSEVYFTITVLNNTGEYFRLFLRIDNATDGSGYGAEINSAIASIIFRLDNGVETQLGSSGVTAAVNDQWGIVASGSSLKLWQNGNVVNSTTDSTYSVAGYTGFNLDSNSLSAIPKIDNFGGGTLVSSTVATGVGKKAQFDSALFNRAWF